MITTNDILSKDGILTYKNYQRTVRGNSIHDFKDGQMESFGIKIFPGDDIEQYVAHLNLNLHKDEYIESFKK